MMDPPVATLYSWNQPVAINSRGEVLGTARALANAPGMPAGVWTGWLWDGHTTRIIEVPLSVFERQIPADARRMDLPGFLLDDGTVIGGTSWIAEGTGSQLGGDVWRWRDGVATLISPHGGDYDSVVDGATVRSAVVVGVTGGGVVTGTVLRRPIPTASWGGPQAQLRTDGWVYSGGVTTILAGLPGAPYQQQTPTGVSRQSGISAVGMGGAVYGISRPYSTAHMPNAVTAWRYQGGVYSVVPLPPGSDYLAVCGGLPHSALIPIAAFDDGGGVFDVRATVCGSIAGGRDAWALDAAGSWVPLSLEGPDYTLPTTDGLLRETIVTASTTNGRVAGRTSVFAGTGWRNDSCDAWYFDGAMVRRVGFSGGDFETVGPYGLMRRSLVRQVNAAGVVLGSSVRYSPQEQAGTKFWIFDPASGTYRVPTLELSLGAYDSLTEGGVVLTRMNDQRPAPQDVPMPLYHAALWNVAGVVVNLNDALVAGLPGPDPYLLTSVAFASPLVDADGWPRALLAVAETGFSDTIRTFYLERASECGAADVGGAGGVAEPDGGLSNDDFVVFIDWFFAGDGRADLGGPGGRARGDLLLDNNDFIVFIDQFFSGCS